MIKVSHIIINLQAGRQEHLLPHLKTQLLLDFMWTTDGAKTCRNNLELTCYYSDNDAAEKN